MCKKLTVPPARKATLLEWMSPKDLENYYDAPDYQVMRWIHRGEFPAYMFFKQAYRVHMSEVSLPNIMPTEENKFMTCLEFSRWVRVSELTVRRALVHPKYPIPHIRIGGAVRIDKDLAVSMARNRSSSHGAYKFAGIPGAPDNEFIKKNT